MLKRSASRRALRHGLLALAVGVALTVALPSRAHIVREEPWHPLAAAYLRSLFYLKLEPVDWALVERELEAVPVGAGRVRPAWEWFEQATALEGVDHPARIRAAITARDPSALYESTTRAMAQLARARLGEAREHLLHEAGAAREAVQEAWRMVRPFERFIAAADPDGARRLGRAWLEITTALGTAGVDGRGRMPADLNRFDAAAEVIGGYLREHYEAARERAGAAPDPVPAGSGPGAVVPWLPPGSDLNDQDPLPRLVLNFEERGIDERDLFLVAYGDMLFDSPYLFGAPARDLGIACATCHNRSDINSRFFIPGVSPHPGAADVDGAFFNPRFNDRRPDPLDIPSLRGLRFTAPYGRDGRFASLRDFSRNVIVNEFAGDEPTPQMLDALVAYMLEFDWLPAPWLRPDGRLVESAPAAARRGEELFHRELAGLGGRSCATCHIPSANFLDGLRHDIGTVQPATPGARDGFLDTPTLINAAHTAPYFHDGSVATLAGVVEWFDERFELGLSAQQRGDLTAYLEAVGTGEDPYEVFDEDNTAFMLYWSELSTFTSTLATLIPARDAYHADVLLRTVADDLRVDATALADLAMAPRVYEIADHLDELRAAVVAGDWDRAEVLWREYQRLEAAYGDEFR